MQTSAPVAQEAFRWSLSKIRRRTVKLSLVFAATVAAYVAIDSFTDTAPPRSGHTSDLVVGLMGSIGGGFLVAIFVASILLIGRACSSTTVTPDGLRIQRSLWRREFVAWSDIRSADVRTYYGWRMLYIKPKLLSRVIVVSLEFDKPNEFKSAVARVADDENPIRRALGIESIK
jgi:hypothetical protein